MQELVGERPGGAQERGRASTWRVREMAEGGHLGDPQPMEAGSGKSEDTSSDSGEGYEEQ